MKGVKKNFYANGQGQKTDVEKDLAVILFYNFKIVD